jgi:ABC-type sugar transport system substrate-binding protein
MTALAALSAVLAAVGAVPDALAAAGRLAEILHRNRELTDEEFAAARESIRQRMKAPHWQPDDANGGG